MNIWRNMPIQGRIIVAVTLTALMFAPAFADRYLLSVLVLVFYFAYLGQAWNILMGFAGQLSLGHALYLGIGAYTAAVLWMVFGIGPWLGVFVAVFLAVVIGMIVGWLGWHFAIEGVYFALLTIAFSEFTRIGFDNWSALGGSGGFFLSINTPGSDHWWNLGGGPHFYYYLSLGLAVAATTLVAWLRQSPLGYRWLAVREDPRAAQAVGINILRTRMVAMIISAGMTAIAGVFYGFYYRNLFPSQMFDIGRSIEMILAPIIGGLGTIFGPVVGAIVLTPLGEGLTSLMEATGMNTPGAKLIFYGFLLMVIISVRPSGLWPWIAGYLQLDGRRK